MTVVNFDPPPDGVPDRLPSPFAVPPHPLARRAADELRAFAGDVGEGKMFGVLVVADRDGRVGYLRAFSGMLGGRWHVDGFVGPAFDPAARAAFWPAGEAELAAIDAELGALDRALAPLEVERAALADRHAREARVQREHHAARRAVRHAARTAGGDAELDRESRHDTAERRELRARHAAERAELEVRRAQLAGPRAAALERKAARSRELLGQIYGTYAFANARGERRTLHELFAPAEPPGGAGDCAAPKLFAHAYRTELVPLALAEVWLGPPPATGGRHPGTFYPACRGKCGPILAHVLGGLAAEPAPVFGAAPIAAAEPRVVFEDAWLVVVDKPPGLLSVPGRSAALQDCVLARLRARAPDATVVHRLDLDASGLLLAAKHPAVHAKLQELFARRLVDKRYVAVLDGRVAGDRGTIELALRVDVDDRPRQLVDAVHGKHAITDYQVLAHGERSRVALWPRTGRTHQLRVHCAVGLGAPIAGDRLYGRIPAERLLLHAEALAFTHPVTGARLELVSRAPF